MTTWLVFAKVARPHGVRGDLKLHLLDGGAWPSVKQVRIAEQIYDVSVRGRTATPIVSLAGVNTREQAEVLQGCAVEACVDELPALNEGEFFLAELKEAKVNHVAGQHLGILENWTTNGAQDLAMIREPSGGIVYMPFISAWVISWDPKARVLCVDPPKGLFGGGA